MVKHARAFLRLIAFALTSSVLYTLAVASLLLEAPFPRAQRAIHRAIVATWARSVAVIMGLRVEVRGRPPTPPFILVCNHLSYMDIVVLMSQVPAVFVAKSEVAGWPFLGRLSRAALTVFLDRAQRRDVLRVNSIVRDLLERGHGVIIFPEGTSSRGAEVLPFLSSLLEPAVSIGHPVCYASLTYTTPSGAPSAAHAVCWWGDMTFLKHFYGMLLLPVFRATLVFGPEVLHADDRHELAASLWRAVSRQFTPVHDPEARLSS